jgi:hypothetical protein
MLSSWNEKKMIRIIKTRTKQKIKDCELGFIAKLWYQINVNRNGKTLEPTIKNWNTYLRKLKSNYKTPTYWLLK